MIPIWNQSVSDRSMMPTGNHYDCVRLTYDAYRESICVILEYDAYRESICVRLKILL